MPSHSLKNPFEIPKERDSNHKAFVKSVLGKGTSEPNIPKEDFGTDVDDIHLSAEDQKRIEDEKIFREIIARESVALRNFFGKEIIVPPLPKQATRERILEWRKLGLELHYLPPISMAEIKRDVDGFVTNVQPKNFPGWKKKLSHWFFDKIKSWDLPPEAAKLPGAWVLVDARPKPIEDDGKQMYLNDFLGPVLEELNKKEIIKRTSIHSKTLLADSRYGLSRIDLDNSRVKEAIAQAMNISETCLSLPSAIEFNFLGNIYYPQWDKTNTYEWFSDNLEGECLFGGSSHIGGLSCVEKVNPASRYFDVGFRFIGRLPSSQEENHKE
ncbi:MAG TPA: hypothetical protein VFQ60_00020 [Patescibacteria group bacterium]|nr:hypothetical protein [Patescibacteria group bacterium]